MDRYLKCNTTCRLCRYAWYAMAPGTPGADMPDNLPKA